ncbi:MAG: FtsX-like permease family protein [Deltaproteobacteria bacterium]|nr:FtsX-like permease family protein [Deltaproteobacteria bacterium]
MRMQRIVGQGIQALGANKMRTFFMMAGTIVGIAALTIIMALGKGTEKKVMKRVETFGPRAMMLIAGGGKNAGPDMTVTTLTMDDARAVREQVKDLEIVTPIAWRFRINVKYDANRYQAVFWGVEPSWHEAWNWYAAEGDGITDGDVATMARVCVIGQTIRRKLFGDSDPVGENIYVNKVRLTVKGVLEKKGTSPMGTDFDNRIIVPITTAMRRVLNVDHVGAIRIITRDAALMPRQIKEIRALIHARHHITPPQEDDFRIASPVSIAKMARGTSRTLSILLIALAGLSLIVGGVVLMNILLISVGERQKEIGLRRAVGATRRDILFQFLAESLTVTCIGMLAGSGLGALVTLILRQSTKIPIVLSWEPFALSLAFALLVGTFFGIQPARKAALLNPVETLR